MARNLQMCWRGTRFGDWSSWPIHVLTEPRRPSHVFSSILVPLPLEYQDDSGWASIINTCKLHVGTAWRERGHTEPEHERPSGEMTTVSQVQSHSILGSTRHKLCSSSQDSAKLCFPRILSAIMTIMAILLSGLPNLSLWCLCSKLFGSKNSSLPAAPGPRTVGWKEKRIWPNRQTGYKWGQWKIIDPHQIISTRTWHTLTHCINFHTEKF